MQISPFLSTQKADKSLWQEVQNEGPAYTDNWQTMVKTFDIIRQVKIQSENTGKNKISK